MAEKLNITLGATPYEIRPFTMGQLEEMHVEAANPIELKRDSSDERRLWARFRKVILIALAEDYPSVTEEMLKKTRLGSLDAVYGVYLEIMRFGGFRSAEQAPGEAKAAPTAAETPSLN